MHQKDGRSKILAPIPQLHLTGLVFEQHADMATCIIRMADSTLFQPLQSCISQIWCLRSMQIDMVTLRTQGWRALLKLLTFPAIGRRIGISIDPYAI